MADDAGSERSRGVTRRDFLVITGSGITLLVAAGGPAGALVRPLLRVQSSGLPLGRLLRIDRATDQLRLQVQLLNLQPSGQSLVATNAALPSYLRVMLPSQHVDEEVTTTVGSQPLMDHRTAGESRIVFEVEPPIDYTLDALMAWAEYPLVLDARAIPLSSAPPWPTGEPDIDVTALELPEGLILSPGSAGRFVTRPDAVTRDDVTEVWTARLGRLTDGEVLEPPVGNPLARVIWTPGYPDAPAAITDTGDPYDRPINNFDRKHLVRAMGDQDDTVEYPQHESADVRQLWVSSAGAFLDIEGAWGGTGPLAAWKHRTVTGRDVSVRIVTRGYLAPFGHEASIVVISERKFGIDATGKYVAQLEQKEFLSIGSRAVVSPRPHAPDGDRRSIFGETTLKKGGLVEITRGVIHSDGAIDTEHAFVPLTVTGDDLLIDFSATDRAGNESGFSMPVAFVRIDQSYDPAPTATAARVVDYLNKPASLDRRDVAFANQNVAFADEIEPGDGRTTMKADSIVFNAVTPPAGVTLDDLRNAGQPAFFPSVEVARVVDDAADAVRGVTGAPIEVELAPGWITDGNGPGNFGAVFLTVPDPISLPFGGDSSGLAAPDLTIGQFGQLIGPSVSLPSAGTTWDPLDALGDLGTILGTLSLKWLVEQFAVAADLVSDLRLPRFDIAQTTVGFPPIPTELCYAFDWAPDPKSVVVGGTRIFCIESDLVDEGLENPFATNTAFSLHIARCYPLDDNGLPGEPQDTVEFALTNFVVQFPPAAPIFAVYFNRLEYLDLPSAPADVDVGIRQVEFTGALNFLDPVQSLLDGVFGAFDVDILDTGIDLALDIPLPSIQLGVFGMSNLRVGVGLDIPFGSEPVITRFSFGTREDPFTLTVLGIGGSGSIELEVAPHPAGIVRAEITFAVVLEIAVDVIVARGAISASIGVALEIESTEVTNEANGQLETIDDVTLTASVECIGEIEVLGILTITVEFLLALEYRVNDRLLTGEVTISVEVDATIAKKQVEFTIEQEFSLGDPGAVALASTGRRGLAAASSTGSFAFADKYDSDTKWSDYCASFA